MAKVEFRSGCCDLFFEGGELVGDGREEGLNGMKIMGMLKLGKELAVCVMLVIGNMGWLIKDKPLWGVSIVGVFRDKVHGDGGDELIGRVWDGFIEGM